MEMDDRQRRAWDAWEARGADGQARESPEADNETPPIQRWNRNIRTLAVCALVASMSANAFTLAIPANHGILTRALGVLAVVFILVAGICVVTTMVLSTWFTEKD